MTMYAILQHLLIICILFCSLTSYFKIFFYLNFIIERTATTRDKQYSEKKIHRMSSNLWFPHGWDWPSADANPK